MAESFISDLRQDTAVLLASDPNRGKWRLEFEALAKKHKVRRSALAQFLLLHFSPVAREGAAAHARGK